jgi:methylated-DNA-[protein]-cysteine S-methyltransferase
MMSRSFALFRTAIGACAVAWSERGIIAVQLPEEDEGRTRARLLRRLPDATELDPLPHVARVIDGVVALLAGERADLSAAVLDMRAVPEFERRVYEIARTIGAGQTLSYGQIAARLGDAGAARAVGQALGRNPFPLIVPCHRVLAAGGKAGGFSAHGGVQTKLRLLAIEGAHPGEPDLFG